MPSWQEQRADAELNLFELCAGSVTTNRMVVESWVGQGEQTTAFHEESSTRISLHIYDLMPSASWEHPSSLGQISRKK